MTLIDIDVYFKAMSKKYKDDNYIQDKKIARILCMIANVNRRSGTKMFKEKDFMPVVEKKKQTPEEMATVLKALTVGMGGVINDGK